MIQRQAYTSSFTASHDTRRQVAVAAVVVLTAVVYITLPLTLPLPLPPSLQQPPPPSTTNTTKIQSGGKEMGPAAEDCVGALEVGASERESNPATLVHCSI